MRLSKLRFRAFTDGAEHETPARIGEPELEREGEREPEHEQDVHVERGTQLRVVGEEAERDGAEPRRRRLNQRFS